MNRSQIPELLDQRGRRPPAGSQCKRNALVHDIWEDNFSDSRGWRSSFASEGRKIKGENTRCIKPLLIFLRNPASDEQDIGVRTKSLVASAIGCVLNVGKNIVRDGGRVPSSKNHVNLKRLNRPRWQVQPSFDHPPNIQCTFVNDGHDILRSFAHDRHEGCLATFHSTTIGPRNQGRWLSLPPRLDASN